MKQHELTASFHKTGRRVGRGIAAGQGKTAGRGTKGQKARTGANSNIPRSFNGGSTPLIQKLPKLKGFKSTAAKRTTVSLDRIAAVYQADEQVTLISLIEKNLVSPAEALRGIKVVGGKSAHLPQPTFEQNNPKLAFSRNLLAS